MLQLKLFNIEILLIERNKLKIKRIKIFFKKKKEK